MLGEAIGLTFQQVQIFVVGLNRIGASRLFDISKVLEVPIGFFFEEMTEGVAERSPRKLAGAVGLAEEPANFQRWNWYALTIKFKTVPLPAKFSNLSNRWQNLAVTTLKTTKTITKKICKAL